MIVTCYKEQLVSFARDITNGGEGGSGDGNEHLHIVIRHFQASIKQCVTSSLSPSLPPSPYSI